MKKYLLIIIFLISSLYAFNIKESVENLGNTDLKLSQESQNNLIEEAKKGNKEVVGLLIEKLKTSDKYSQFKVESLLYYFTEYQCYGICIGNSSGISEWEKWWKENKGVFNFPKWNDGYYRYYYGSENNYLDNLIISYWKNSSVFAKGMEYIESKDDKKNDNKDVVLIKRLLDNLIRPSLIEVYYTRAIFDSYGKGIIPLLLSNITVEEKEYLKSDYCAKIFESNTGLKFEKSRKIDNSMDMQQFKKEALEWWQKQGKSFVYTKDRLNYYNQTLNKKKLDRTLSPEDEVKIKTLLNDFLYKDDKASGKAFSELYNKYGRSGVPFALKEFVKLDGVKADKLEGYLMSVFIGEVPVKVKDSLDIRKKKWIDWYEKNYGGLNIK